MALLLDRLRGQYKIIQTMNRFLRFIIVVFTLLWFSEANAHELRPAYLEIIEQESGAFL